MTAFQEAVRFVLSWEGSLNLDPNDSGNWTGGKPGSGELRGTKYGISAASYPHLDIPRLTEAEAIDIYQRDYWNRLGLGLLPREMAVLMFDTAVQHGAERARKWHDSIGNDPGAYYAKRMGYYTSLTTFQMYGKGWMRRMSALAAKVFGAETVTSPQPPLQDAKRFFLVLRGSIQIQLPMAKASVVGDKLYVRMFGPKDA